MQIIINELFENTDDPNYINIINRNCKSALTQMFLEIGKYVHWVRKLTVYMPNKGHHRYKYNIL